MTSKLRIDEIVDSTDTGSPNFPLGVTTTALSYTGTLTGGTGVINIGSGQVVKDADGNVGIGTSSMDASLEISRPSDITEVLLRNTGSSSAFKYTALFQGSSSTGISEWNESGVLEATSTGGLYLGSYDGPIRLYTGSSARTERARIDTSGNFLVGTTSAYGSSKLSVNGSVAVNTGYTTKAGASGSLGSNLFNIEWTGSPILWIDNTNIGVISTTSDYRIKKNITIQTTPALERVMQLRPVNYELADYGSLFKADGVAREGFIAHELAEVIPSAVDGAKDSENKIQSLRLDALVSVLTKAIQELSAKVDTLQAELNTLKGN